MTNEIKEILECMSKVAFHEVGMQLETEQVKTLLDYITNLQEEKQRLLESADCLSKGYSELEQRIDKATELIENRNSVENKKKRFINDTNTYEELLEILKGDKHE